MAGFLFFQGSPHMSLCHFTLDFSVSRHHRHSRQGILSSKKKTTSEFFQPSARARVLCCKNGVVLHKTYLAICSGANKSVREGRKSSSSKRTLCASKTSAYRLGAKLLSLVSKSLIFYGATNTQIDATSTQLAKRAETRG